MDELSLHIIDIVHNSVSAGAKNIEVIIIENDKKDIISFEVIDDGKGMDEEILKKVTDPFFTTRDKKVGLGIPLLKQLAESTGGSFEIKSKLGEGTSLKVILPKSNPDIPPLGNLTDTILNLLFIEDSNIKIIYKKNNVEKVIDSKKIKEILGEVPLSNPDVIKFLKKYINSEFNLKEVNNET
ncbi:MAG: ATP-binding protein [Caldisericia bacterium]